MDKVNFLPFIVVLICYLLLFALADLNSTIFLSVNDSTNWTNNIDSFTSSIIFFDVWIARFIIVKQRKWLYLWNKSPGFGFGFFCKLAINPPCYLAIAIIEIFNGTIFTSPPQIVWSANGDHPVKENATLEFSNDGGMILADADGTVVWSTSTSGKSIAGMDLHDDGNLVLFNQTGGTVWQSFDHPTNTILVGQTLRRKQQIVSTISSKNLTRGLFYITIDYISLSAYVKGERPVQYMSFTPEDVGVVYDYLDSVRFNKANVTFFYQRKEGIKLVPYKIPKLSSIQFLRLDVDGGLRIYGWDMKTGWRMIFVLLDEWDECQFPLKCGRYGLCKDGQCTCPKGVDGFDYFRAVDIQLPNHGCQLNSPSSLQNLYNQHQLIDFGDLSYFSYFDPKAAVPGLNDEDNCKQACLQNSSCKATFFCHYIGTQSEGHCFMPSDLLSLMAYRRPNNLHNSSAYIKVNVPSSPQASPSRKLLSWVSSMIVIMVVIPLLIITTCFVVWRKKKRTCIFKRVSEIPLRFSYHELYIATRKFTENLGGGGFGAVFKGVLRDGTVIAVKRLDNVGQGTKEFLAEVETIGNIHHINLVKLIGFCTEKSHRLLVYEYMSNGSLEKWIFCRSSNLALDWDVRRKIMLHVAKALTYLHEDCRQRVAHLDVKPHNILIDDNFNAKLSDFGLSKLIGRDESQVITNVRGTLGYLAPEWQYSRITVKADIYSFGVVLIEVVSGRKILDYSRPESDVHLLNLLRRKAEEDRLMDIVDYQSEDMQFHEEVIKIIRLGMWCLNSDQARRPPMSTVVKVLEGTMELEPDISYNFSHVIPPPTSSISSVPPLLETSALPTSS